MKKYDLEERTTIFSINIINFLKKYKNNYLFEPIFKQLIRSSTSVGANYQEANGASSRNDFRNKIYICKKEIQETKYWLKLLGKSDENLKKDIDLIYIEAQELSLIFGKISGSLNKRKILTFNN